VSVRILVLFDKHAPDPHLLYTAVDIDQNLTSTGATADEALEILAKTLQINEFVEPDPDPCYVAAFESSTIVGIDDLAVVKRVSDLNGESQCR